MTMAVNPGALANVRNAYRRSCSMVLIDDPSALLGRLPSLVGRSSSPSRWCASRLEKAVVLPGMSRNASSSARQASRRSVWLQYQRLAFGRPVAATWA